MMKIAVAVFLTIALPHATGAKVSSSGDKGSANPVITADELEASCGLNLPGGLVQVSRGVDITTLDLANFQMASEIGFTGGPVIEFSCREGSQWRNVHDGQLYQRPDQVWGIDSVVTGFPNIIAEVVTCRDEVRDMIEERVNVAPVPNHNSQSGFFSNSHTLRSLGSEMMNKSEVVTVVTSFLHSTQVYLSPSPEDLKLTPEVVSALNNLPNSFEQNKERYTDFIRTFGTHYFTSAKMGPFIQHVYRTSRPYMDRFGKEQLKEDAKKSFLTWVRTHANYSRSSMDSDSAFDVASPSDAFNKYTLSQEQLIYGGQTSTFMEQGLFPWAYEAIKSPWIFSGQLRTLSDLIEKKSPKREALEKAVQSYLDKAYLSELETIVADVIKTIPISEDSSNEQTTDNGTELQSESAKLMDLLKMVKQETSKEYPNATKVAELESLAKFHIELPNWWQKTELCFKFIPDREDRFCTGESPTCASIGSFTQIFKDWSRSAGGCQLSWGIFTPKREQVYKPPEPVGHQKVLTLVDEGSDVLWTDDDKWFRETKFCFKYFPTGVEFQCGNGSYTELCVGLNEFTPYYHDHSDSRRGGCELAWKLQHPTVDSPHVPSWFSSTRLCHRSQVFSRAVFKGTRLSQWETKCARVSEFTPPFSDGSMFRIYLHYRENYIQWAITSPHY
ncbi:perivitellin-2 67 kDa subunit-like isoform X2 [Convolutriloba macropyga]|uniref:perivitellin-2 67 kDa subunit-like isoform X2 n=1 Tax=Convolutriloba macropyga TaxID=536237 RepID=UPI003F51CEB1